MPLDDQACYRALVARDARFDGVFFVGVRTTGIYCRPVCRARTPRAERCVFFAHVEEAERDGFRACFRCRPERAPGSGSDSYVSRTVGAAVARIEAGALNDGDTESLARELGVTSRHLRRCTHAELGVSPLDLAITRKLALARELLHGSSLSVTDVAFASGFRSVRRFNDAFRTRHGRSPRELRKHGASSSPRGGATLTLDYRPPYDWRSLLAFLAARAVAGVEAVVDGAYVRSVGVGGRRGWISVGPAATPRHALSLEVSPSLLPDLMAIVARVRRLFDLDARPSVVDAHLARDPRLAPLVKARPGLRVPGGFDPVETAIMAILGQQVTVRGGVTVAGRLVAALGDAVATPFEGVRLLWPTPDRLARTAPPAFASLGMPSARAHALAATVRAFRGGRLALDGPALPGALEHQLLSIPGVGPWTAQYILMRGAAWPDAFPDRDVGVARALGVDARQARARVAEAWRPWRSYATMHLWTSLTGANQ